MEEREGRVMYLCLNSIGFCNIISSGIIPSVIKSHVFQSSSQHCRLGIFDEPASLLRSDTLWGSDKGRNVNGAFSRTWKVKSEHGEVVEKIDRRPASANVLSAVACVEVVYAGSA